MIMEWNSGLSLKQISNKSLFRMDKVMYNKCSILVHRQKGQMGVNNEKVRNSFFDFSITVHDGVRFNRSGAHRGTECTGGRICGGLVAQI